MATASGGESWHSPTVPLSAEQLADPTGAGETAKCTVPVPHTPLLRRLV